MSLRCATTEARPSKEFGGVISIETSRSDMELFKVFGDFEDPNKSGPSVWDIHSLRAPSQMGGGLLSVGSHARMGANAT